MDVLTAVSEIRMRLDEIEELTKSLPAGKPRLLDSRSPTFVLKRKVRDWLDINGITKSSSVRTGLLRVATLAEDGLTLEQIKRHSLVRRIKSIQGLVDDFYRDWMAR